MRTVLLVLIATVAVASAEVLDKQATNDLIARIAATATKDEGISFRFKETKHLRILKKPVVESGAITFMPPDRFRRVIETPHDTTTLCDGKVVWITFPDDKLAEKYPLERSPIVRDTLAAISSAIEPTNLTKYFDVTAQKKDKDYVLTLVPRSTQFRRTVDKMFLTLNSKLRPVEVVILSQGGDRSEIALSNERRHKTTEKDFQFTPPADWQVSAPLGE